VLFSSTDCARARESVSVQLDGELPELELDRLETHLRFCPDCSAWAEEVRDITLRLRAAGSEEPAERFVLPRGGRRWTVSSAVALASAAAVVATMFVGSGQHPAARALPHAGAVSASASSIRNVAPRLARFDESQLNALAASQSGGFRSTDRVAV
jgi:hypothetical protein